MSSFEAEWARIKQEVAGGPTLEPASASADRAAGGGSGTVRSSTAAWNTAARGLDALVVSLGTAAKKLHEAQQGFDTSGQAFDASAETLAAQDEVYGTWSGYLSSVTARCRKIQDQFVAAGKTHSANDTATTRMFDDDLELYKDTPDLGGGETQAGG